LSLLLLPCSRVRKFSIFHPDPSTFINLRVNLPVSLVNLQQPKYGWKLLFWSRATATPQITGKHGKIATIKATHLTSLRLALLNL